MITESRNMIGLEHFGPKIVRQVLSDMRFAQGKRELQGLSF